MARLVSLLAIIMAPVALTACKPAPKADESPTMPKIETAEQALIALQKSGLPIADIIAVTEATDENKLLGRPNQYTSKANFGDTRHPKDADDMDPVDNTIEGFGNVADAKRRAEYIGEISKSMPMFTQYIYQRGKFVLRLHKSIAPAEAKAYEENLKKLLPDS